jgi:hypothetical protein
MPENRRWKEEKKAAWNTSSSQIEYNKSSKVIKKRS